MKVEPPEDEVEEAVELIEDESIGGAEYAEELIDKVPELAIISKSFSRSFVPMMILDTDFRIAFANEAFERLFAAYCSHGTGSSFARVFSRALGVEGVKALYSSLKSSEASYCWKGTLANKTRGTATMLTKAYIIPHFVPVMDRSGPVAFFVIFDDVTEENKALLRSTFLSLLEASKLKDNDTGKHIERVNLYARRLAEVIYKCRGAEYPEVDMDFVHDVGFLAAMHDVGKIGTPDDILNKEGPLEPWEWKIMKEHTINGAYILSTYPNPMARQIALSHHEKWDGNGYPYSLEGRMIPLAARITTLADVYDALRMKRSYKPSLPHEAAVAKIMELGGTHFDPSLVELFGAVKGDFEAIYAENEDSKEEARRDRRGPRAEAAI